MEGKIMAGIIIDHLKYKYPGADRLALNDISLTIEPGEFIGIIGRNESGKSSLCQAVAGLIPNFYKGAYGGRVLVGDVEVKTVPVDELCETVGIVFQNPFNQVTGSKATVYEEIAFGLENMGVPKDEMIRRIDEAMELLDIPKYGDRYPFDLSGGQMQRMAIASIIAMQPQVIILDEPTSQLDPQGREEVFQAVQKLSKRGITIILVEHNMEKIAEYSDRVVLLDDGKLIAADTPQRIFSRDDLDTYGVEAPVYTQICRAMNLRDESTGCYPVTLTEARALLTARGGNENA
jgi:energy-coupling factor transport system ATP-binding protein